MDDSRGPDSWLFTLDGVQHALLLHRHHRFRPAQPMTPASPRAPRVVVAEHESIIRMDIAEIFAAAGYLVVAQARSANEAVVLTLFLQPDLLVFD